MQIESLSNYWGAIQKTSEGYWVHPEDRHLFVSSPHSFNLDYPPPAFVGDIINAKVVILTANGGYKQAVTPHEFPDPRTEHEYVVRLTNPSGSDWRSVAKYYSDVNYADFICRGIVATVNACAYRSPKISAEPENRKLIKKLPSAAFTRRWLIDSVVTSANRGEKLVVAKRYGLWNLPKELMSSHGVVKDPAPVSPYLAKATLRAVHDFLA
ncbi:MAG: hypothetical protein AAGB26_08380 [Planctomycetota bacterium]